MVWPGAGSVGGLRPGALCGCGDIREMKARHGASLLRLSG